MATSFMESPSYLFTSESVTEGHPDKLCDQISDGVLDAIIVNDPNARVACETAVTTGLVVVMGEISCDCYVEIPEVVRETLKLAGYTKPEYGFDYQSAGVMVSIKEQSSDIDSGVSRALEVRNGKSNNSNHFETIGAGDQGMMFGFACNETPEYMPMPIWLAHKLCRRLAQVRKEGILPYLRPDGKSQVTVEYSCGVPKRVDTIIIGAHHNPEVSHDVLQRDIERDVIKAIIPSGLLDKKSKILVNTAGRFVIGGPVADTGVTGRKILVDSYGGFARVGGGCFSGKDPTKVDRSAAYAARYIAKNIVAAGFASHLEIQISYAIGKAHPVSISLETFGTARVKEELMLSLINKHFDLRPGAIIDYLKLRRPIYRQLAAYGHFGREDLDLTWEKLDKVKILKEEAGLC